MGNLSKHFDSSEFACQCGCGDDRIDPELVDLLEEIRVALDRPVRITSGVRCQSHNESIGGVAKSAHVPVDLFDGKGPVSRAVDIAVPRFTIPLRHHAPALVSLPADRIREVVLSRRHQPKCVK